MSSRLSINVDGYNYGQLPIPAASRVGPLVMTSSVHGMDPATGALSENVQQQTKQMFENLRRIMTAAGGSLEQIARINFHVALSAARVAVNEEFVRAFPDPASRPARHTSLDDELTGFMVVRCDATAWIA